MQMNSTDRKNLVTLTLLHLKKNFMNFQFLHVLMYSFGTGKR